MIVPMLTRRSATFWRVLIALNAFGTFCWWGSTQRALGASFQVSPLRFELSLDRRYTDVFIIYNISSQPLRIRVNPRFMSRDATGKLVETQSRTQDLSSWVFINPRMIRIQPADKQIVRFTVRPPAELDEGEYRTVLFIEELPKAPVSKAPSPNGDQQGVDLRLNNLTRLGVNIYGLKGTRQNDLVFELGKVTIEGDRTLFTGNLRNRGNAHVLLSMKARLVSEDDDVAHVEETRVILQRDEVQRWRLITQIPLPGTYYLHITASHRDSILIEQSFLIQFAIPLDDR